MSNLISRQHSSKSTKNSRKGFKRPLYCAELIKNLPKEELALLNSKSKDKALKAKSNRLKDRFQFRKYQNWVDLEKRVIPFYRDYVGVENARELVYYYINQYETMSYHKGSLTAIKRLKEFRTLAGRFASNQKFDPIPFTASDRDNVPAFLKPYKDLLMGEVYQRQAALGLLELYKLLESSNDVIDYGSITDPPHNGITLESLGEDINYLSHLTQSLEENSINPKRFMSAYRLTIGKLFPKSQQDKRKGELILLNELHISNKNGPNGPAMSTSVLDAVKLSEDLYQSCSNLCEQLNWDIPIKLIDGISERIVSEIDKDELVTSRLSLKQEAGGKNRLFAIVDYWSQTCLKSIHLHMFEFLKNQPQDGTFDQNRVSTLVKDWTADVSRSQEIYSFDLSKATDRLPALLLRQIVNDIYGPEIAREWYNLLTQREFKTHDGKGFVRYTTGQPMGALSSWASLAIWHHVIIQLCFTYCNVTLKPNSYVVIGDDVAINDKKVASLYRLIVDKILGIGISESKGFSPETISGANPLPKCSLMSEETLSAEIAKRIFINGHELTPIPPDLLIEGLKNPLSFGDLLRSLEDRCIPDLYVRSSDPLTFLSNLSLKPRLAKLVAYSPINVQPPKGLASPMNSTCDTNPWQELKVPYDREWYRYQFNNWVSKWITTKLSKCNEELEKYKNFYKSSDTLRIGKFVLSSRDGILMYAVFKQALKMVNIKAHKAISKLTHFNFGDDVVEYNKALDSIIAFSEVELAIYGKYSKRQRKRIYRSSLLGEYFKYILRGEHEICTGNINIFTVSADQLSPFQNIGIERTSYTLSDDGSLKQID